MAAEPRQAIRTWDRRQEMKLDAVRSLELLLTVTTLLYCDPFVSLVEAHARPISRQPAAKLDVRNSLKRWDRPFGAVLRGAEAVGYHNDGQLSTRHLTDATAQVTDTYTYDGFGVTLAQTGSTANNYLYTGEQLDLNVGLYYLRARYHNQAVGRFMSQDPFEGLQQDPLSLHRYLYAHAQPESNRDPSGLFTLTERLVVAALAILLVSLTGTLASVISLARRPVPTGLVITLVGVEYTKEVVVGLGLGGGASLEGAIFFKNNEQGLFLNVAAMASFGEGRFDSSVFGIGLIWGAESLEDFKGAFTSNTITLGHTQVSITKGPPLLSGTVTVTVFPVPVADFPHIPLSFTAN